MTPSNAPPGTPEQRFRTAYHAHYRDLLRFVTRRVHPSHAEDVVADAFLVVWRRRADLPPDPQDARAWIFGVARNVLLNEQRGDRRRQALAVRLADDATGPHGVHHGIDPEVVAGRLDLAAAWPRLTAVDQEVLALAYWDDLDSTRAGAVLGISPVAFRLRLTRARRALRRHLDLVDTSTVSTLLPEGTPS